MFHGSSDLSKGRGRRRREHEAVNRGIGIGKERDGLANGRKRAVDAGVARQPP